MYYEQMTVLYINTSSNKEIKVGLTIDGQKDTISQKIDFQKAQVVLGLIDKILKEHTLNLKDITKIKVVTGPGSFTGLRVGIAVANALGWSLNIPVNGKRQLVEPSYS